MTVHTYIHNETGKVVIANGRLSVEFCGATPIIGLVDDTRA